MSNPTEGHARSPRQRHPTTNTMSCGHPDPRISGWHASRIAPGRHPPSRPHIPPPKATPSPTARNSRAAV